MKKIYNNNKMNKKNNLLKLKIIKKINKINNKIVTKQKKNNIMILKR